MNKYKLFMIISICTLFITIGISYAWYVWKSETNAIVNLDVCTPTVYFSGGQTINGKNFMPVLNKEDGIKKEIEVRLNKSCDSTAFMNLYMKLDILEIGLSNETFVYELYKGTELITSGNFANKQEGDIIELASNEIINENLSTYLLYIYIDGTKVNPVSMQNQSFSFSLYSEGTGAIYKENVIKSFTTPSNSDSTFLDTNILRKEIQSIEIAKDNSVPEGVIGSIDISSVGDESVMLWYKDEDNNNLYEVYIGGKNGIVKANTSGNGMFAYLTNATSINLSNFDTSSVTNMSLMFYDCSSLTSLDLSSFDTSKVTNIEAMFCNCSSLTSLNLSSFDTSKVTDMGWMFGACSSLVNLNLSNFNTSSVTNMSSMFCFCSSLTDLDLSSFNTSNVTNTERMFECCTSLISLDLNSFNTSSVTNMSLMFYNCTSLTSLDLSSFDTSSVTSMGSMFDSCKKLASLNLSNFDFSNVSDDNFLFNDVSTNVRIKVKDRAQMDWITSKYPNFVNVVY